MKKRMALRVLSFALLLSVILSGFASAAGGYGDNAGSVNDNLDDAPDISGFVTTKLEAADSTHLTGEYGSVKALSEVVVVGEEAVLKAIPHDEDYSFARWENADGEEISKDATLTYTFKADEKITAVFTTNLQWDITFENGMYGPANAGLTSVEKDKDGNTYLNYHAAGPWALAKILYNSTDLYSNTKYQPNKTYKLGFDYFIKKPGDVPTDVIGVAPHMSLYTGNTPTVRIGADEENTAGWTHYEVYFKTDEQTGMGYSYVADGLFQICAGKNFEIHIDNLRLGTVDDFTFENYKNPETVGQYEGAEGTVILPKGMPAVSARMLFENAPGVRVAKNGKTVSNNTAVSTGMTLTSGDTVKAVVVKGDLTGDGKTTVSDIVAGVTAILDGGKNAALDVNGDGRNTVTDLVSMRKTVLSGDPDEYENPYYNTEAKAYDIRSMLDYVRLNGRYENSIKGITFDFAGMSMQFAAFCEGTVKVQISNTGSMKYTVFVDGKRMDESITGFNWLTLATGLEKGYHTFEIARQADVNIKANIDAIKLCGTLLPVESNENPSIEFIGDSVTSGVGSVYEGKEKENVLRDDATSTYAFLTAHELNLPYKTFSCGGVALTDKTSKECIKDKYVYKNPWKSMAADSLYDFNGGSDIVVINLGTNDRWSGPVSDGDFKNGMNYFLNIVREKNPNAKIVWVYGMMFTGDRSYSNVIKEVMADLGGAEKGYFSCELPYDYGEDYTYTDKDGKTITVPSVSKGPHFYSHPVKEGHEAAAKVLTEFLKTEVIK